MEVWGWLVDTADTLPCCIPPWPHIRPEESPWGRLESSMKLSNGKNSSTQPQELRTVILNGARWSPPEYILHNAIDNEHAVDSDGDHGPQELWCRSASKGGSEAEGILCSK